MFANKYFLIIIVLLMVMLAFSNCYYDAVLEPLQPKITGDVSFSKDLLPIFNQSCSNAGCHDVGGQKPDLTPANAYNALIGGGYVDVASPASSELYRWMRGDRAQPMPLTGSDPTYNAKVLAWINQGAQNN